MQHGDDSQRPGRPALAPEAERWLGRKIPCLDHGFVYLVDVMGSDASIVQAARVSYGRGTKTVHEDRGLIRYLMRHAHTTPFEMVELKFHVKLPIFVARQWIRHRTACLAGDTVLLFDLPDGDRPRPHRMTIRELHALWHRGDTTRHRLARMPLRTCDEATGRIRHTVVTDVWETGVRPVFRVTLDNGYRVKMTKDHRCLTEAGWKTLAAATSLRWREGSGVTWRADGPAFAVNGIPLARESVASDGTPQLPGGALMRAFATVARIELAGHEPTYDLAVRGPWHNFVANGFIVHNSVNEVSGRYSVMPDEFYVPAPEHVTEQATGNRQGGGTAVPAGRAAEVLALLREEQRVVREGYDRLLGWNIRRELARINLGVAQYTEWYWKSDLHNIFHFLKLRLDEHAQYEIRVYAQAMAQIVKDVVPLAWEAFEDYQLHAERFSRLELEVLARLLARAGLNDEAVLEALPARWRERTPDGRLKRNRERDELLAKLRRLAGGLAQRSP